MKILVQVGGLGGSVIDHLIGPLAKARNVSKVWLICRYPGPAIPGVEYHCPPGFLARYGLLAIAWEYVTLVFLALFRRPTHVAGYLLFPHGLAAAIVARATRKPVIISLIAGPVELYAPGSPLGVDFTRPLSRYGRLMLKWLKSCDAIITTGSFTKHFLAQQGVPESRIHSLIHPADELLFYPSDVSRIYDILGVGRLAPVKHVDVIVRAVASLKATYPSIKAGIVGDGPCKPELLKLAADLGVRENIDFIGYQKDMLRYYSKSRIFVHTSEREGFPNVLLEAMLCGLPCVVSNCGDIIDIATDGFNSLVIPRFNDHESFARAIGRLLKDERLYSNLSANAVKSVKSLSAEDVTREWEVILDSVRK